MNTDLPSGIGLYVWNIVDLPDKWDELFYDMGITWIAVKIADGVNSSNLRRLPDGNKVDDIMSPFIDKASEFCKKLLGWQYIYGFNPDDEAHKAIERIAKFGLDGFIIDAEHQYKGKYTQATRYTKVLRANAPNVPIGLSTYRFPGLHPRVPYKEFLEICDFNAPQVYWNKDKAGIELRESYIQYKKIKELPFIPAGRAYYGEGFPKPTPKETQEFLWTAQQLGCPAAFFWSSDTLWHRTRPLPEIQKAIKDYDWETVPVPPPVPQPEPSPTDCKHEVLTAVNNLELHIGKLFEAYRFENDLN